MKKHIIIIAFLLGIGLGASAQTGGLFGMGPSRDMDYDYNTRENGVFSLPSQHGAENDESAPLGGGALLLIGFGAAYALRKKRNCL